MRIIFSLLFIFIIACESNKDNINKSINDNNPYQSEIQSLIKDTELLEDKMNRNIILRSATTRQRASLDEYLFSIKKYLFLLQERPGDYNTLKRLFNTKKELEKMPTQARDFEFFNSYFNEINQLILKLVQYQNKNISDLNWQVWNENFNSGIGLFTQFGAGDTWQVGNRNRQGYISARTRRDKAWLITPIIDLNTISNPAFNINHVVNIKQNENFPIDRELINKECLKVFVSENYEFGNPENAIWDEIQMPRIPLVEDFNAYTTKRISLANYSNKKISLAFVLDLQSTDINGHGLLWQINELKLFGAQITPNPNQDSLDIVIARKDPTNYLYQHDFTNGYDDFVQLTQGENPALFDLTTRNDETYLQVNGFQNKSNGVNFLIGPQIKLTDLKYSIRLKQAINFYNSPAQEKEYIKILIGIDNDYSLNTWEDVNQIEWKELAFEKVPPGNAWTPVESEWLALEYQNTKIRFAFRYESGNGISEYPNWSLYTIDIKEEKVE